MENKDPHQALGVARDADDRTIKQAYRRLARKHHPDVSRAKGSADRFKEINEAYEVLSDSEKRKRYDSLGPDWQRYAQAGTGPFQGFRVHFGGHGGDLGDLGGFSDFFRTIFGDLGVRGEDPFAELRRGEGRRRAGFRGAGGEDTEAALGTEVRVPTLKGSVAMKIPPETSGGKTFRLPGYGMPHLKGGGTGDQYVKIKVVLPSGLTAREKARV